MKQTIIMAAMLGFCLASAAQDVPQHNANQDSADVFFRHLKLNEVEVTGLTGQTKMREMAAPVTVVTARELRSAVGTNIIDVISRQPGIAQITTGSAISKPVIRGLGYNRVLVVNDGVRQEGQQWGDEHGLEVDAQAVGSAEILKGPASLMYGSDAMAGVLILKSAPVLPEGEMRANVATGYQSNNGLFDYTLNMAGHQDWFVWSARYSEKMAHEYKNSRDGYVPGTQFHERAGHLMLGVNRDWGHSHLSWAALHLTPSMTEGERDEETGELIHDYDLKTYHKQLPFQEVKHYKATWDNSLRLGNGQLKGIFAYQQNRRQEFEDNAQEPELYFRLHTLTYDVRYQYTTPSAIKLAAGMNGMYQKSENLAEESLIPAYHLFDFGAYGTASATIGKWTHSGGLRFDNRSIHQYGDFQGVTGSLGTVFHANDAFNLRANVARGFRAPNMSELGSDGIHEGTLRYEVGNADLKAEQSWQADLGADFSSRYFSVQASLFLNHIGNYIFAHSNGEYTVDEDGQQWRTFTYTQGTARLYGFEASLDIHPFHQLHLGNSFSLVEGRLLHQPEDTRYLPMMPAPRWQSELKYELTHRDHRLLNNAYVAVDMECNLAQNHYYRADDTETRTPSYTLFNISAGTDLQFGGKKRAEVYFSVQNLFDRVYQNHLSRFKYTDVNPVTGCRGIAAMGRNVTMKLVVPISFN